MKKIYNSFRFVKFNLQIHLTNIQFVGIYFDFNFTYKEELLTLHFMFHHTVKLTEYKETIRENRKLI